MEAQHWFKMKNIVSHYDQLTILKEIFAITWYDFLLQYLAPVWQFSLHFGNFLSVWQFSLWHFLSVWQFSLRLACSLRLAIFSPFGNFLSVGNFLWLRQFSLASAIWVHLAILVFSGSQNQDSLAHMHMTPTGMFQVLYNGHANYTKSLLKDEAGEFHCYLWKRTKNFWESGKICIEYFPNVYRWQYTVDGIKCEARVVVVTFNVCLWKVFNKHWARWCFFFMGILGFLQFLGHRHIADIPDEKEDSGIFVFAVLNSWWNGWGDVKSGQKFQQTKDLPNRNLLTNWEKQQAWWFEKYFLEFLSHWTKLKNLSVEKMWTFSTRNGKIRH